MKDRWQWVWIALVLWQCPLAVNAQSFRVESQVHDADSSTLIAESLTLFNAGMVFDFSYDLTTKEPVEIIIYDSRRRQFTLLDCRRKLKLVIESYELVRMLEEQRRELSQQETMLFLAEPKFQEHMDLNAMTVELSNAHFTYCVAGERPRDGTLLAPYHEYLDVYARLAVTDPYRLPPFARIQVNQALRKAGWIPREVELWVHSPALPRHQVHWKSRHTTTWTLSDDDHQRMEAVKRQWLSFKSVSLREYRQIEGTETQTTTSMQGK